MTNPTSVSWLGSLRAAIMLVAAMLTGCAGGGASGPTAVVGSNTQATAPPPVTARVKGVLHGGQAPIVGATLTLYVAGVPASASPTTVGTATTDANGNFAFPGFSCATTTDLMYIVAGGGNSGGGINDAIKLMAALGPCGSVPASIVINELTTVAAVYALNAFSNVPSGDTGLGGCVDCAPVTPADMTQLHGNSPWIKNAFNTAALLADVATGQPAQSLPLAASCAANAPINCDALLKLNGLGNAIAACVNSAAATSAQCTALFDCAGPLSRPDASTVDCASPAGSTLSTDTLEATLAIARNPGLVGAATIQALSAEKIVFSPSPATLSELTIALNYTDGGLSIPEGIAIDAAGNVWIPNGGNSSVTELNSSGVAISPPGGFTGGGLSGPLGIAIDGAGNVWMPNLFTNSVSELNSTGVAISPLGGFTGGGLSTPAGIAVDGAGNVWISGGLGVSEFSSSGVAISPAGGFTDGGASFEIAIDGAGNAWTTINGSSSVGEFNSSGMALSPVGGFTGGGLDRPFGIAIDSAGYAWIANEAGNSVSKFTPGGIAISPAVGITGGGLSGPTTIAIDGAGNVWVANYADKTGTSISELSSSGTVLSPAGFTGNGGEHTLSTLNGPAHVAIDGAGDVWVTNIGDNSVTEFIGAAASTLTPLVAQITPPAVALVSIAVTPGSSTVTDGSTQQFTATGTYADNSTRNISASVTWGSSNTGFATIAAGGLATCVAPGTVNITATLTQNGATVTGTGTQALTCSAPAVTALACYPAPTPPGGGAFPYANESYCATFSGTIAGYAFTGTLTFTTPSTWPPGTLVACQFATTGTYNGAPASTPATTCPGSIDENGDVVMSLTSAGFAGTFSGTNDATVSGNYSFTQAFGPGGGTGSGTFTGNEVL